MPTQNNPSLFVIIKMYQFRDHIFVIILFSRQAKAIFTHIVANRQDRRLIAVAHEGNMRLAGPSAPKSQTRGTQLFKSMSISTEANTTSTQSHPQTSKNSLSLSSGSQLGTVSSQSYFLRPPQRRTHFQRTSGEEVGFSQQLSERGHGLQHARDLSLVEVTTKARAQVLFEDEVLV